MVIYSLSELYTYTILQLATTQMNDVFLGEIFGPVGGPKLLGGVHLFQQNLFLGVHIFQKIWTGGSKSVVTVQRFSKFLQRSLVPRPHLQKEEKGLVNLDRFLGF